MNKTRGLLFTAGIVLAMAFTFSGCKEEAKDKPAAVAETAVNRNSAKKLPKVEDIDIVAKLIGKEKSFLGRLGDGIQRMEVVFLSAKKIDKNKYEVTGKSKVKNNICDFTGTIEVQQIKEPNREKYDEGKIKGKYHFDEDKKQSGTGVFDGTFTISWIYSDDGEIIASEFENYFETVVFGGTWKGYRTGASKKACWSDDPHGCFSGIPPKSGEWEWLFNDGQEFDPPKGWWCEGGDWTDWWTVPKTANTFTDSRDGKKYKTVKICEQVWMAENLNYKAEGSVCYGEGGGVVTGYDDEEPITKTLSSSEVQANCAKYGRLYDWETANKACPAGWHLPSDKEWDVLMVAVGGVKDNDGDWQGAGKKLKSASGWNEGGNGTDAHGFSALPGGSGNGGGLFDDAGDNGYWWSATTEYNASRAWGRYMYCNGEYVGRNYGDKSGLYSVRCVRD